MSHITQQASNTCHCMSCQEHHESSSILLHVFSYTMPLHARHNMHERTYALQNKAVHKQFFGYMHDEHHTWACAMYLYNTFTCHSPEPRAIHVDDGVQQAMMKPIRLHESLVSLLYIFELKGMLAYCS